MGKLADFQRHLRPGKVYRRADLAQWSSAVDRHIQASVRDGRLVKLAGGLYSVPKQTAFGQAPADDVALIEAFLKGSPYLKVSPNLYNGLGVGLTQLHNRTIVYNHKRHGRFRLGGREFDFRIKPRLPAKLTLEFLLVDLVNNLGDLGEDRSATLARVKAAAQNYPAARLRRAAEDYGKVGTRKFFDQALNAPDLEHA
ncbi:MAG: hypothetical protein B7Z12_19460 [Caulobacter vibrioides]|jgi:hypothetical protein|uniref:Transcriptional regulator, AbiEi antitoxin, Type IV TA system n=1 Tax=Caulobacter vibrioides TaxID=155892 RepID=A0A258CTD9_CAUVI|nr:MAG: hypothetical protein B7Z12_19460 [Caulobacter vibrioides]